MSSPPAVVHVIHTNDFHNSLTSKGADILRSAVQAIGESPHVLLDAGDAVGAGNIGVNLFGEPILNRMSELGYDAMTMGNREFHVLGPALRTKIGRADFPVLCANVRMKSGADGELPVVPSITLTRGGIKIIVFGVTIPMVTERMKIAASVSDYLFDDPVDTARRLVAELRWNADILIALTHIGIREDERLASSVSGIDLIIGGHSHVSLAEPRLVGRDGDSTVTPIVQAGWHARSFGSVTLERREPPDEGWRVSGALHPLQARIQ